MAAVVFDCYKKRWQNFGYNQGLIYTMVSRVSWDPNWQPTWPTEHDPKPCDKLRSVHSPHQHFDGRPWPGAVPIRADRRSKSPGGTNESQTWRCNTFRLGKNRGVCSGTSLEETTQLSNSSFVMSVSGSYIIPLPQALQPPSELRSSSEPFGASQGFLSLLLIHRSDGRRDGTAPISCKSLGIVLVKRPSRKPTLSRMICGRFEASKFILILYN